MKVILVRCRPNACCSGSEDSTAARRQVIGSHRVTLDPLASAKMDPSALNADAVMGRPL
jgi:hypothetical protein